MNISKPLEQTGITVEERQADAREMLALAAAHFGHGKSWLLAESPRRQVFQAWTGSLDNTLAREFTSLVIFAPDAEIRMEKPFAEATGWLRLLRDGPAGEPCLVRAQSAILRDKTGQILRYAEYFKPDSSGFLLKTCWRLCAVEES